MTERWSTTAIRAIAAAAIVGGAVLVILLCLGFSTAQMAAMFSHPITGGTGESLSAPAAAPVKDSAKHFGAVNYSVVVAYLLGMLVIGWITGRRIKGTRGFFIGDGKIHYILLAFSLLGTYLSALTMMSLSGMAYGKNNWLYVVQLPCLILTAVIVTRLVLPRFREAGVISVYEYLEQRIHVSVRVLASVSFVALSIGRMGLLLFLPALALTSVTGFPLHLNIIVIGVIVTFYTVLGGIEAVIWTDAVQVGVIVVGTFVTLGYLFVDMGVDKFLEVGSAYSKFQIINPSLSLFQITTAWLILETIFQTIRIYSTQQDMTQRYMTTDSTAKANRSVWISIVGYIPLGFIFYFIGTALFAYYKLHPGIPAPVNPDGCYPHFIGHQLPPGLAGLVVAAIFAASMSSIDSLMNSSSTVCVQDFLKRFGRKDRSDDEHLRWARLLTLVWGILAIALGLIFTIIWNEHTQIIWGKLMAVTTNGVLGLMALAFLPWRVRTSAAIAGFAASTVSLIAMMVLGINFLLWSVVGNTVCFVVAVALNALFAKDVLPEERKAQA